jgi:predicted  nucleic acid-binding Zn-ribbon protein
MVEQYDYAEQYYSNIPTKMRDLEEKQRILKDRLLLIGENLVELKEKTSNEMLEIKKDIEEIKNVVERLKAFLETASSEFSKFARKEDVEILAKQAKMFQPLEFVRISDLEKLKKM